MKFVQKIKILYMNVLTQKTDEARFDSDIPAAYQ